MVKTIERSGSTGYYYGLPKIGRAQLSRHYYDGQHLIQGECIPHNIYSQKGGSGLVFENMINFLLPIGRTNLMAIIILLVLQYYNKYNTEKKKIQRGGSSYINIAEKALSSLNINTLAVIAGLLLLNYLNKGSKMVGGIRNDFWNRLVNILGNRYNEKSHIGGMLNNIGTTKIAIPALLMVLDNMFKNRKQRQGQKQRQKGGECMLLSTLQNILHPMNINSLLATIGLISLSKAQKGGKKDNCQKEQKGGCLFGEHNCGLGNNALEVVGDKALYYNDNLSQFGCTIPSWGSNLEVQGQGQCI